VVARQARVPVVPVTMRFSRPSLCWVGDDDFFPHYMRTTSWPSTQVTVQFGAAIDSAEFPSARALCDGVRAAMLAQFEPTAVEVSS